MLAALGGALVGAANGWLLLRRARLSAPRRVWVVVGAVLVVTAAAGANAARAIAGQGVAAVLGIPGAGPILSRRELAVAGAGAACGLMAVLVRARRPGWSPETMRAGALVLTLLVGLGFAAWIAWLELRSTGVLGYYFWKFATALVLVSTVTGLVALASSLDEAELRRDPTRAQVVASLAVAAAALVVFGAPRPRVQGALLPPSRGLSGRVVVAMAAANPGKVSRDLLAAAAAPRAGPVLQVYIAIQSDGVLNPGSAAQ